MKETLNFTKGQHIISKGEPAQDAFLILKGKVCIYLEEGTKIVEMAQLEQGEIFGETAIFQDEQYGASAKAVEDCTLQIITSKYLKEMLDSTDPVIQSLIYMLIKRLKNTNEALLKSETREFMDIALI